MLSAFVFCLVCFSVVFGIFFGRSFGIFPPAVSSIVFSFIFVQYDDYEMLRCFVLCFVTYFVTAVFDCLVEREV